MQFKSWLVWLPLAVGLHGHVQPQRGAGVILKALCTSLLVFCLMVSIPVFYGVILAVVNVRTINADRAWLIIPLGISCLFALAGLFIGYAAFLEQRKQNARRAEKIVELDFPLNRQ